MSAETFRAINALLAQLSPADLDRAYQILVSYFPRAFDAARKRK